MYTLQQNTCAVDDSWGSASAGDIASSAGEQAQIALLTTGSSPIAAAAQSTDPNATVPSIFNGSIGQAALQQLQQQAASIPSYNAPGAGPVSASGGLLNASQNQYTFASQKIIQANPPRYYWFFEKFETGADCGGYATPWAHPKADTMSPAWIALALLAAAVVA